MYQYFNNIIPKNICNNILEYSKKSPPEFKYAWGGRQNVGEGWLLQNKTFLQTLFFITQIASRSYGKILFPELLEVVEWPIGSLHTPHLDSARKSTSYTSIIYLNEDYIGGQTYFTSNNFLSKNKTGDILMFDGTKHEHGVTEVIQGTRYVISIWYSENINDFILSWTND